MMEVGAAVVAYLAAPREQVFGVVITLDPSGVVVRGLALSSVEDWLREVSAQAEPDTPGISLATTFYPMHRIEKIVLDEPVTGLPSIADRFRERVGLSLAEWLAGGPLAGG